MNMFKVKGYHLFSLGCWNMSLFCMVKIFLLVFSRNHLHYIFAEIFPKKASLSFYLFFHVWQGLFLSVLQQAAEFRLAVSTSSQQLIYKIFYQIKFTFMILPNDHSSRN